MCTYVSVLHPLIMLRLKFLTGKHDMRKYLLNLRNQCRLYFSPTNKYSLLIKITMLFFLYLLINSWLIKLLFIHFFKERFKFHSPLLEICVPYIDFLSLSIFQQLYLFKIALNLLGVTSILIKG